MSETLNLARRPFVNRRPVTRTALLLWLVGAVLLAWNARLYWRYFVGSDTTAAELGRVEERIAAERGRHSQLQTRLDGLDLVTRNRQIAFLNQKIAERTFSWSLLFDRLAEVLPRQVRLYTLAPQSIAPKRFDAQQQPAETVVKLKVVGASENDEAMLELLDALYAHPSFEDPNLMREAQENLRLIRLNLDVDYYPERGMAPLVEAQPAAPTLKPLPARPAASSPRRVK